MMADSIDNLLKQAELGNAEAQYTLGKCYGNGKGVKPDDAQAVKWFTKAAEQNVALAQYNLGICYYYGKGVKENSQQAVMWWNRAANQGVSNAQNCLGVCYEKGSGVKQDDKSAFEWYEKAAKQGHAIAQNNLGLCYEEGRGVKQDDKSAFEWYEKAAKQGESDAQTNLGRCYEAGFGVTQNPKEAFEWYEKAAKQGNRRAQANLGGCYMKGSGVEQNTKKAFELFKEAAEKGSDFAQYNLGLCYRNGVGVEQNSEHAKRWFEKAAEQGNFSAKTELKTLELSQKRSEELRKISNLDYASKRIDYFKKIDASFSSALEKFAALLQEELDCTTSTNFKIIADKYALLAGTFRTFIHDRPDAEGYVLKCSEKEKENRTKSAKEAYECAVKDFNDLEIESKNCNALTNYDQMADKYRSLAAEFNSLRTLKEVSDNSLTYALTCKTRAQEYVEKVNAKLKEEAYDRAVKDFQVLEGKICSTKSDFMDSANEYNSLAALFMSLTCKYVPSSAVHTSWDIPPYFRQRLFSDAQQDYKEARKYALQCTEKEKKCREVYAEKVKEENYDRAVKDFRGLEAESAITSTDFHAINAKYELVAKYELLANFFRSMPNYPESSNYAIKCEKHIEAIKRIYRANQWVAQGLCPYDGGQFKVFSKKCKICDRPKEDMTKFLQSQKRQNVETKL